MQNAKLYKTARRYGRRKSRWPLLWQCLSTTPIAQSMKKKIDKSNFIETKHFCSSDDDVKWMRRQDKVRETICKNAPDKGQKYTKLKTQQ